jgi:hypothetical protein
MDKQLELEIKGLETHGSWVKWDLPDGYEFQDKDGNVINTNIIKLVKKQPKYPTTYEGCCGVLGITFDYPDIRMVTTDEYNLYSYFIQLIRCRDAYWKVADNWKPYWTDNSQKKFTISYYQGEINLTGGHNVHRVLAFPTKEMRDAFYENFENLINECKELL